MGLSKDFSRIALVLYLTTASILILPCLVVWLTASSITTASLIHWSYLNSIGKQGQVDIALKLGVKD